MTTGSAPSAGSIVVVAARRTPIGRFLGGLSGFSGPELGAFAVRAVLDDLRAVGVDRLPDPRVVLGSARQAGAGPNPARQVAVRAGLDESTVALTINMACASGLEAIAQAARLLASGEAESVVAGGMESMSRVPFLLDRMRNGYRLGHAKVEDAMYRDGFLCPLAEQLMGETAETLAAQYAISRSEQDAYALESQTRATRAQAAGRFDAELVAVPSSHKGKPAVTADEHVRGDTTLESLAKLPPVFSADGCVTAGNASGITDGAAALVLMRGETARRLGAPVLATLDGWHSAGVDPRVMGIGPVPAVRELLARKAAAGGDGSLRSIDLVELNEAFAAQVLAVDRELAFDREKLNVNGGAIALGHPIGASGARIVVTLLHEMIKRDARRGLATLCVSGGMGHAMLFQRQAA
ncbi:MAG: thiolase family protein [Candidatus Eisenbacteria bacterium]